MRETLKGSLKEPYASAMRLVLFELTKRSVAAMQPRWYRQRRIELIKIHVLYRSISMWLYLKKVNHFFVIW